MVFRRGTDADEKR